jgi:hypothetical protein
MAKNFGPRSEFERNGGDGAKSWFHVRILTGNPAQDSYLDVKKLNI